MPLSKNSLSGAIDETLSYVSDSDYFGAQILDVVFYDENGDEATPTGGSYRLQWSPNGRKWIDFGSPAAIPASSTGENWQASGYIHSIRALPSGITGASTWDVLYRLHGIGKEFPFQTVTQLSFGDRIRTVTQSQREASVIEGDSYRIYLGFGAKSNLADSGVLLPQIPAGGNVWVSIKYTALKLPVLLGRRIVLSSGKGLRYIAYSPGSPLDDTGTLIPARNLNLLSANTADTEIRYIGTTTPTQFTGATEIDYAMIPDSGGGGGSAGGSLIDEVQFILTAPGSETLVQIYNPSNAAVTVKYELQISEISV